MNMNKINNMPAPLRKYWMEQARIHAEAHQEMEALMAQMLAEMEEEARIDAENELEMEIVLSQMLVEMEVVMAETLAEMDRQEAKQAKFAANLEKMREPNAKFREDARKEIAKGN